MARTAQVYRGVSPQLKSLPRENIAVASAVRLLLATIAFPLMYLALGDSL
jgi:hypothetical protein